MEQLSAALLTTANLTGTWTAGSAAGDRDRVRLITYDLQCPAAADALLEAERIEVDASTALGKEQTGGGVFVVEYLIEFALLVVACITAGALVAALIATAELVLPPILMRRAARDEPQCCAVSLPPSGSETRAAPDLLSRSVDVVKEGRGRVGSAPCHDHRAPSNGLGDACRRPARAGSRLLTPDAQRHRHDLVQFDPRGAADRDPQGEEVATTPWEQRRGELNLADAHHHWHLPPVL
jgi:hypothetical protein